MVSPSAHCNVKYSRRKDCLRTGAKVYRGVFVQKVIFRYSHQSPLLLRFDTFFASRAAMHIFVQFSIMDFGNIHA